MNTPLYCLPCFLRQALRGANLVAPDNPELRRRIVLGAASMMEGWDLTLPPPEHAVSLREHIRELTGIADVFAEDKRRANERVLALLPDLERRVSASGDPLRTALEISIVGNYMDSGAPASFDWESALEGEARTLASGDYTGFAERLRPGADVLILGDNAGEIGLDRLLVAQLRSRGCRVTYAVRSAPIINDATLEDARAVGLDSLCKVVASGSDAPGTLLGRITDSFRRRMDDADVILSKGQGNFESLFGEWADIFFAFKVKCAHIRDTVAQPVGTSVFLWGARRVAEAG